MTVESNYAIAIATLGDWFNIPHQFIKQLEGKYKPITTCTRDFSCALSKLHARNEEFGLVHCAVCACSDWSKCFTTLN